MTNATRIALGALVALVAQALALTWGWWWVTMLAGLVVGLTVRRRLGLLVAAGTALVAWGGVLLWRSGGDVARAGDVVGALALDARGLGGAVAALTLFYGLVLALVGFWVGWLVGTEWQRRNGSGAGSTRQVGRADVVPLTSADGSRPQQEQSGRRDRREPVGTSVRSEHHAEERV